MSLFGTVRVSQDWSIPGLMLGDVRVEKGAILCAGMGQRRSWDGDLWHWQENGLWVGTSCSCRDGEPPLCFPSLPKEQGRKWAGEG